MGVFFLCIIIHVYINELLTRACTLRLATELLCLCLTSETVQLVSGFFACHRVVLLGANRSI